MEESWNERLSSIIRLAIRTIVILIVTVIIWGCTAVPQLTEGSEANFVRLPFVRVLLQNDIPEITVSGSGTFSLECLQRGKSFVYFSSQPVTITIERGLLAVTMRRDRFEGRFEEVIITPRNGNGFLSYQNQDYRGMFRILPHGVNLRLINVLHMDDYLKGVVPPEIGKVTEVELEAIKAQAVAARTYSMRYLGQYAGEPYDMRSDVSDQLYHGANVESELISRAIDDTRGIVIKYEDNLINAYYHSTCGGYTDDIEEVWDKPAAPYLKAVDDSGICNWSKYFHWEESFTAQQLKMRIEQFLSAERGREIQIGDILDIKVTSLTAGGRVAELIVKTAEHNYTFGKDRVRWVFKRSSNPEMILQSARFDVITEHDTAGRLTQVRLIGGGYGHGVGMCQCGAIGMARKGIKFDQILPFYYKNIRLVKLY
jgi:stage II sporulation protein D (peptidoglycan lytic transglycosylase)